MPNIFRVMRSHLLANIFYIYLHGCATAIFSLVQQPSSLIGTNLRVDHLTRATKQSANARRSHARSRNECYSPMRLSLGCTMTFTADVDDDDAASWFGVATDVNRRRASAANTDPKGPDPATPARSLFRPAFGRGASTGNTRRRFFGNWARAFVCE